KSISGSPRAGRIYDNVLLAIYAAVIRIQQGVLGCLRFKSLYCRVGMDERYASISSHYQIRHLAKDVPPASVADKVIRDQAKSFKQLQIKIDRASAAGSSEMLLSQRIIDLKAPRNSLEFDMEQFAADLGIERHFAYYVRMQVRHGRTRCPIVELRRDIAGS